MLKILLYLLFKRTWISNYFPCCLRNKYMNRNSRGLFSYTSYFSKTNELTNVKGLFFLMTNKLKF